GILLFLTDVAMLTIAFILGYLARFVPLLDNEQVAEIGINLYLPTMILHVVTIITIFYMSRLYHLGRAVSRIDLARNIFGAVTIGAVLAYGSVGLIFNNTQFDIDYPRTMFFYVWLFSSVFAILGREAHQSVVRLLREHGYERVNLLILGTGKIAREIARKIKGSPMLGYNIVGVVNGKDDKKGNMLGIPILGSYHELPYLIDAYQIEQVII